jgi:hypothetical protein
MSRASNEAATDVDRPSDGGPFLGITLLFVALLALALA